MDSPKRGILNSTQGQHNRTVKSTRSPFFPQLPQSETESTIVGSKSSAQHRGALHTYHSGAEVADGFTKRIKAGHLKISAPHKANKAKRVGGLYTKGSLFRHHQLNGLIIQYFEVDRFFLQ